MPFPEPVVAHMQSLIERWESEANPQAVFLRCYQMMTGNMLDAIERREFDDPEWVRVLLNRFADYYFVALEAYQRDPAAAPAVWRLAHDTTRDPAALALQHLLLGVNAHINYDLVLTLAEVLGPEWGALSEQGRASRHADYGHVNDVIAATIDSVQDQILEPTMPALDLIDKLLGRLDELLVSRVITDWRETVWQTAGRLLEAQAEEDRAALLQELEERALRFGQVICLGGAGARRDGR